MSKNSLAGTLGEFVSTTSARTIPAAAIAEARIRLLDALGCALASFRNVPTKLIQKLAHDMAGSGPSTFWMMKARGRPQDCAFVNSVFVHSILHEDAGVFGHPACNVIPSALAVGEAQRASGADILDAIVIGYELQTRIAARGSALKHVRAGGLRPTAMSGIFGSAGAAARLMKLSPAETKNTIAFCASLCSPGLEEPLNVGGSERSLQMGQLTRSGVLAAELGAVGFEGADSALDGDCGFYFGYLGAEAPVDVITGGLGEKWMSAIRDGLFIYKPYPTAALNIGPIYCALQILAENKFDHRDVASILVRQTWWDRMVGYIYNGPTRNVEQALLSSPFAVAATLVHGGYDWPIVEKSINNKEVDALAAKVLVHGSMGAGRRRYETASVEITLNDGRTLHHAIDALPQEMVLPNWDQVVDKFHTMTSHGLNRETRSAIVTEVQELDRRPDIGALVTLLAQA